MIFSFLGWCVEVLFVLFNEKKLINRGFLIGPICPIYGAGCVLLYYLLKGYADDPIMLFLAAVAVCSILEYITSYVMELIFKMRWWDYSDKKFNINGRICLEISIPFGILGLLVVYILYPFVLNTITNLPNLTIYITSGIVLLIFLFDIIFSFNIIMKFPKTATRAPKDMTEEITNFVKNTLFNKSTYTRRLIKSFPDFQFDIKKIHQNIKEKIKK